VTKIRQFFRVNQKYVYDCDLMYKTNNELQWWG